MPWPQIFFFPEGNRCDSRFPLNIGLAFPCAMLFYYPVDQPAIQLGRRSSVPIKTEACPVAESRAA
jgi:hypothetical protein